MPTPTNPTFEPTARDIVEQFCRRRFDRLPSEVSAAINLVAMAGHLTAEAKVLLSSWVAPTPEGEWLPFKTGGTPVDAEYRIEGRTVRWRFAGTDAEMVVPVWPVEPLSETSGNTPHRPRHPTKDYPMGIDAMVYAEGRLTDELHEQLTERFTGSEWEEYTTPGDWGEGDGRTWVVWRSFSRFYGPGYERGDWLTVASAIETVRAVFGHVYYHGDHSWYGEAEPHTVADTEALWAHWRGPNWDDYHK